MFVEITYDFYLRLTIYVLVVIYLLYLNCVVSSDWMDTRSAHVAQIFLDLYSPRMKRKDIRAEKESYIIYFE